MTTEESAAWTSLMRVVELLPVALNAQLQRDSQLTHFEFLVLSALQVSEDPRIPMSDLARAVNATLPRLSHVCARLEARGLIERHSSHRDGRSRLVTLTRPGRAALIRAVPGHFETARALVIDALTPAQLASLREAADAIGARLDPEQRFVWTSRADDGEGG